VKPGFYISEDMIYNAYGFKEMKCSLADEISKFMLILLEM
jgi:hypothetical protein